MSSLAQQQRTLVEQHRRAQVGVQAGFLAEFLAAWGLLRTNDLDETTPGWLRVIMRLIRAFRQESADSALNSYRELRRLALPDPELDAPHVQFNLGDLAALERRITREARSRGTGHTRPSVPGRFTRETTPRIDGQQPGFTIHWDRADRAAEASLRIAGPINIKSRIARGESPEKAQRAALVEASGAASRHVLNGGRGTNLALVQNDRAALGWVRVTDGNPCAFCAMLASRGVTWGPYAKDSFAKANKKVEEKYGPGHYASEHPGDPRVIGRGEVKVHDHCACGIALVFRRDDPLLDQGKQYRQLWDQHIKGRYGGDDAIRAWRRLHERPEVFTRKAAEADPRRNRRAA